MSFVDLPELRLMVARPGEALPSLPGRKLYGVVYTRPEGVERYAGVEPEDDAESERLGLSVLTVPAGPYARANLMHWEEHRGDIGPMVDQMIESVDHDPSRPVLEYHRTSFELQLLVPVGG